MYNVKGKLSKYNKDWNNVKLFEDQVELNNFLEYSKQDSISLLQALLSAQKLYLNDYELDITKAVSTPSLSLLIFRLF